MAGLSPSVLTWVVAAAAIIGVILRPLRWAEAVWAVTGALLLVLLGLLSPREALSGIGKGADVYLFLIGMMLLSEVARETGLFGWMAAHATRHANGSARRLFLLIYGVGTVVTIFLSNDAAAVVLTPAVAAAARAAKVETPLPYLLICAFIANAASFVLPISNPANLVIYGDRMPPLLEWLSRYAVPSLVSILATYAALRWTQRRYLHQPIAQEIDVPRLSGGGHVALVGLVGTALVLLACSGLDVRLGLPTCLAGIATAGITLLWSRTASWSTIKGVSWGVLPLVAGLFVLVEALGKTGLVQLIADQLAGLTQRSSNEAIWVAGLVLGFGSNLMNNLPAGLIAGNAVTLVHVPEAIRGAALIGVDLGPNLSVTGSLATILWLTALRREGQSVSAWSFLKIGAVVMPPALVLALGTAVMTNR